MIYLVSSAAIGGWDELDGSRQLWMSAKCLLVVHVMDLQACLWFTLISL